MIDGVKLPSNASKHRSGTRADFLARAEKLERVAKHTLDRHRVNDDAGRDSAEFKVVARIERMANEAAKIRTWLTANPNDPVGTRGGVPKSNLTDSESAQMATDMGVIRDFCAFAVVDAAHQIIVEASAHGTGSERELLLKCVIRLVPRYSRTKAAAAHHAPRPQLENWLRRSMRSFVIFAVRSSHVFVFGRSF